MRLKDPHQDRHYFELRYTFIKANSHSNSQQVYRQTDLQCVTMTALPGTLQSFSLYTNITDYKQLEFSIILGVGRVRYEQSLVQEKKGFQIQLWRSQTRYANCFDTADGAQKFH